jgi:hypothetical protein
VVGGLGFIAPLGLASFSWEELSRLGYAPSTDDEVFRVCLGLTLKTATLGGGGGRVSS